MGYVSVVTGGAGGMGIDICKRFAKETKVFAIDFLPERIEIAKKECEGLDVEFIYGDVTDKAVVQALADKASTAGDILYVCHAAGISDVLVDHPNKPEDVGYNNVVGATNVLGIFTGLICEGGSIVSIASMTSYADLDFKEYGDSFPAALKGDLEALLNYSDHKLTRTYAISKGFLRWLSNSYVGKVSERGARINTISPGFIWTPMTQAIENLNPMSITPLAYVVPQQRLGEAEDIGETVDFLNHAKYVNGADILVDGGYYWNSILDQIE